MNGDCALSYNGAKTATRKNSFKSSAINEQANGGKKKRKCGRVEKKNKQLKLFTMPRTI